MSYVALYLTTLIVFLVIDALWISNVMKPLFQAHIGDLLADEVRFGVAAGFYAIYVAGIVYFAQIPALDGGGWSKALISGMLFGFIAYGTYEATNMATLRGWSWNLVIVDMLWGSALTGISALAGFWIVKAFGWTAP